MDHPTFLECRNRPHTSSNPSSSENPSCDSKFCPSPFNPFQMNHFKCSVLIQLRATAMIDCKACHDPLPLIKHVFCILHIYNPQVPFQCSVKAPGQKPKTERLGSPPPRPPEEGKGLKSCQGNCRNMTRESPVTHRNTNPYCP